jgi:hypothetical protein
VSSEMPVAPADERAKTAADGRPTATRWLALALTALFVAAAVLFVSLAAAVSGLV